MISAQYCVTYEMLKLMPSIKSKLRKFMNTFEQFLPVYYFFFVLINLDHVWRQKPPRETTNCIHVLSIHTKSFKKIKIRKIFFDASFFTSFLVLKFHELNLSPTWQVSQRGHEGRQRTNQLLKKTVFKTKNKRFGLLTNSVQGYEDNYIRNEEMLAIWYVIMPFITKIKKSEPPPICNSAFANSPIEKKKMQLVLTYFRLSVTWWKKRSFFSLY